MGMGNGGPRHARLSGALLLAALVTHPAFAPDDSVGARNIRLRERTPGLYLAPKESAEDPEAHNFSTTLEPLADLDPTAIEKLLKDHPDLSGFRIVLVGPPVSGERAGTLKTETERVLSQIGVESQVQVIRHPHGLRERLLNLIPRREDFERPIPAEIKVAAWKVILAESLSFAVLLVPPAIAASEADWGALGEVAKQIALPWNVAVPMVVLDIAQMIPLVTFRRTLSNHNIRLGPGERFARQFFMSMFFSFNFYMTSQWPRALEFLQRVTERPAAESGGLLVSATGAMLSVIVPASIFNMLSRTTVGTSLNIWEHRAPGRRFAVAVLEAITGLLIAPLYILSTMPVLEPVFQAAGLNMNAAHLGLLGIGVAGGIAWAKLEYRRLKAWVGGAAKACGDWLFGWSFRTPKP